MRLLELFDGEVEASFIEVDIAEHADGESVGRCDFDDAE